MARFYSNENIPIQVVKDLRHDVLTSVDAGNANAAVSDAEVLAFATALGRILLSHNRRHFLTLHRRRTQDHPGMILCTFDPDFERQARRIDAAIAATESMRNVLIRVNRPA